ncbi:hypothetical protein DXG01_006261 [Tephrocybe rancida]|nr:hypothetical protein DXG01_006261 [Tephrocybe rancida]
MLIRVLCKDEVDWEDFRSVGENGVFGAGGAPDVACGFDDNMGLESISELDADNLVMDMDMEDEDDERDDEDEDGDGEQFFETRKDADNGEDDGESVERDMYEEGDIEDDWVDPSMPTPIPSDPPAILVSSASVGVPSSNQGQEHFLFPMTQREEEVSPPRPEHCVRHASINNMRKRTHMARARDGGGCRAGVLRGFYRTIEDTTTHARRTHN